MGERSDCAKHCGCLENVRALLLLYSVKLMLVTAARACGSGSKRRRYRPPLYRVLFAVLGVNAKVQKLVAILGPWTRGRQQPCWCVTERAGKVCCLRL